MIASSTMEKAEILKFLENISKYLAEFEKSDIPTTRRSYCINIRSTIVRLLSVATNPMTKNLLKQVFLFAHRLQMLESPGKIREFASYVASRFKSRFKRIENNLILIRLCLVYLKDRAQKNEF